MTIRAADSPFTHGDYARLFESTSDAVAAFLPDLRAIYVNPAFRAIVPITAGQTLQEHLGPLADVYDAPILGVARGGQATAALLQISSGSGNRALVGNYTPIPDDDGAVAAILLIAHDLPG